MNIGVVGGGINGLCCGLHLVGQGYHVRLYEKNMLIEATSRASCKLLHSGLRYLENEEFCLVRDSLRERYA
jgi:glycerol-3-phosphate dehydrogenase